MSDCMRCDFLEGQHAEMSTKLDELRERLYRKNLMLEALKEEYDTVAHGRPTEEPCDEETWTDVDAERA